MKAFIGCILTIPLAAAVVITAAGSWFVLRVTIYFYYGIDIQKKYDKLFSRFKERFPYKDLQ